MKSMAARKVAGSSVRQEPSVECRSIVALIVLERLLRPQKWLKVAYSPSISLVTLSWGRSELPSMPISMTLIGNLTTDRFRSHWEC
jgi:hypothetical protein